MRSALFAAALLILAACTAESPRPSVPGNQAQLTQGSRLFATRCSTCHALPATEACTKGVMDAMAPEADLKPQERAAVEAYLASVKK